MCRLVEVKKYITPFRGSRVKMNLILCVSAVAFWISSVDALELGKPCRCVPIEKCASLAHMMRPELEAWFEEFSCDTSTAGEIPVPFGFATLAKGDSVCCPKDSNDGNKNKNPVPLETSILFDNNRRHKDNIGDIHFPKNIHRRTRRQDFDSAGTVDSINSQINARRPIPNNRGRNYEFPTFGSDGIPRFTNENNGGRLNRQTDRPSSEVYFDDMTTGPSINQGSANRPQNNQPRRRPNIRNQNQMNMPDFMGDPLLMTQTQRPGNRQMQMGNMQDNNSFGRRNMNQCSGLSSFPPDPSLGCCGVDLSSGDRVNRDSQTRNFAPGLSPNAPITGPESFLGGIFKNFLDFGNFPSRFKRAAADDVNVTIDSRITGGKVTELNQFPWTVLLKTTFDYGSRESAFACGGSLISAMYVLTAAHCVVDENARVSEVEITLAEYNKDTFPNDCINGFGGGRECVENMVTYAEDVIPHPEFDDSRLQNDIALLRLRTRAPYTEFIRPICLPPIDIDSQDFSNIPLSVAGWGRNGRYNTNVKQSTVVNLVPQRECKRSYSQLTRRHLCAAGYSGEDTCKGDSGGPLMILYEGKFYISGIVSGKRADSPCGTSVPSLYTNVYHYLDWIRSNIRN